MNISRMAAVAQVGVFLLTVSAKAQVQLTVSPKMDIFRAGGYDDASNGDDPTVYRFAAARGRTIEFSPVTGVWNCLDGGAYFGPEGTNLCPQFSITGPVGPFSGFEQTDFQGALVGMFLGDLLPDAAPPTLRFYVRDSSMGGISTNFRHLAPRIGQVFFIGNGRTGVAFGALQQFAVPDRATRLYLGYVDACLDYSTPGCYSDNSGGVTVDFSFRDAGVQIP